MDSDGPYLGARVGSTQKVTDGGTSDGSSSSSSSTLNCGDGSDGDILLAETGLDVGNHSRDENSLRNHFGEYVQIEEVFVKR